VLYHLPLVLGIMWGGGQVVGLWYLALGGEAGPSVRGFVVSLLRSAQVLCLSCLVENILTSEV
jgi:hypothetical protein